MNLTHFFAFSVVANPENPPKIDWSYYKNKVPIAGMVDNFQKQYESLSVPYPADTISASIEAQRGAMVQEIEKFKKESAARIAQAEKDIAHLKSLIPFGQMTMEDFAEAYPDQAFDPINKPTFWPHDEAEQRPRVEPNHDEHH